LLPEVEHIAAQLQVPSAQGAALRCRGLLARDPDILVAAVDAYRQSPRVVELVGEGATNREVAAALVISTHTVDSHLRHVFAKLDISSRVQLAAIVTKQTR
jgi:ATP/maltotriose-dependent transcriptional regulator MalT